MHLEVVIFLQVACAACCSFTLITLASPAETSQTVALVLSMGCYQVPGRRKVQGLPWCSGACFCFFFFLQMLEPVFSILLSLGLYRSLSCLNLMWENNTENLNYWVKDCYLCERAVVHLSFTSSKLIRNCFRPVVEGTSQQH